MGSRKPIAALVGLLIATSVAQAQREITIHLKNGTPMEGRFGGVEGSNLIYSTAGSSATQRRLASALIDWVEFRAPEPFIAAQTAFREQRFAEAAEGFEKIATQTRNFQSYYYPIPGNFVMLARKRLIDCYRRLARPYDVHFHLRDFQPEMLPTDERTLAPSVAVWEAAGRKGWDDVLKLAEERKVTTAPTSTDGCEIAYLSGLAHQKKGDPHKALLNYSQAYSLNGATDTTVARVALIAAARLLEAEDPITKDEKEDVENALVAQVQIYSNIFGKGKPWDAASERITSLNDVSIEIAGAKPEDNAAKTEHAAAKKGAEAVDVVAAEAKAGADDGAPAAKAPATIVSVAAKPRDTWKATGPNILANGSFETIAESNAPNGWELEALVGEVQAAVAPDGKDQSICVMVRLTKQNGMGGWSRAGLQLKKNADYRLSGWVRTAGIKDPRKGATIELEDSNLQTLGKTKILLGDNDWTRVEVLLQSGESKSFKLFCLLSSPGTAWFDDIELVPVAKRTK